MNNEDEKIAKVLAPYTLKELIEINELLANILFTYEHERKDERPFSINTTAQRRRSIGVIENLLSELFHGWLPYPARWVSTDSYLVAFGQDPDDWMPQPLLPSLQAAHDYIKKKLSDEDNACIEAEETAADLLLKVYTKSGQYREARFSKRSYSADAFHHLARHRVASFTEIAATFQKQSTRSDSTEERKVSDALGYIRKNLDIPADTPDDIFIVSNQVCTISYPVRYILK